MRKSAEGGGWKVDAVVPPEPTVVPPEPMAVAPPPKSRRWWPFGKRRDTHAA